MTRVRLQDVADRAGVSAQTVSRVLRTPHLVAPATVVRIRAIMEELGYVRNEQATALRLGRTRTIGLLFHLLDSLPMPFALDIIAGAEERASSRGYSLVMCDVSGPLDKEAGGLSLLLSQRVAGIIYTVPRCRPATHAACAHLIQSGTPVVVISSDPQDLPYWHVRTDDTRAGYVAVRHLLDLGRRRIALIAATTVAPTEVFGAWAAIRDRLDGASAALDEHGLDAGGMPLYLVANTSDGGRAAGEAILAGSAPLPDGIFVTTDIMALGLMEALRAAGIQVPGDIAVVGHDDLFTSSIASPSLTTIAPPRRRMGQDSVDLLLQEGAHAGRSREHILDAEFIVRESTIGPSLHARDGLRAPLSADHAWSSWRGHLHLLPPTEDARTSPVLVSTLAHRHHRDGPSRRRIRGTEPRATGSAP